MLYIDSGSRIPAHALATWLQRELTQEVCELRWQSGFFSEDALPIFEPVLRQLAASQGVVNVLIGSNECDTLAPHVDSLVDLLGLPRANAQLGIVCFANAYFHPKTYHIKRKDGSQAAYIGSANFTPSGISGLHVEAGIIVDTNHNDPARILNEIAVAADVWFAGARAGIELINDHADVQRLLNQGVLSAVRPPRPANQAGGVNGGAGGGGRPSLAPPVPLPRFARPPATQGPAQPAVGPQVAVVPNGLPATPQPQYPPYVRIAQGATQPTTGANALSGIALPNGSVGIIYRLTRDSGRAFSGGDGTANITIPVNTMSTLLFGMFRGSRGKVSPRAEFEVHVRYLSHTVDIRVAPHRSNIMLYGYGAGTASHTDRRLVLSRTTVKDIVAKIRHHQLTVPAKDDYVFLEWPTPQEPQFRVSLLERNSQKSQQAAQMLTAAVATGQLVGTSCWLPPNISPPW